MTRKRLVVQKVITLLVSFLAEVALVILLWSWRAAPGCENSMSQLKEYFLGSSCSIVAWPVMMAYAVISGVVVVLLVHGYGMIQIALAKRKGDRMIQAAIDMANRKK